MYMRSLGSPTRLVPISDFMSVQRALRQSILEDAFQNMDSVDKNTPTLKIRVDVSEDKEAFYVRSDLPGVSEKDVEVTFDEGVLTLKGEKKSSEPSTDGKADKMHVKERLSGSFNRQIALGTSVEISKIEASFDKGVLTIEVPKVIEEKSKAHKIDIKMS